MFSFWSFRNRLKLNLPNLYWEMSAQISIFQFLVKHPVSSLVKQKGCCFFFNKIIAHLTFWILFISCSSNRYHQIFRKHSKYHLKYEGEWSWQSDKCSTCCLDQYICFLVVVCWFFFFNFIDYNLDYPKSNEWLHRLLREQIVIQIIVNNVWKLHVLVVAFNACCFLNVNYIKDVYV